MKNLKMNTFKICNLPKHMYIYIWIRTYIYQSRVMNTGIRTGFKWLYIEYAFLLLKSFFSTYKSLTDELSSYVIIRKEAFTSCIIVKFMTLVPKFWRPKFWCRSGILVVL